jgi:hypothetical protein
MTQAAAATGAASAALSTSEGQSSFWLIAWNALDGNWIDGCSLLGAGIYMLWRWNRARRAGNGYRLKSKRAAADFANGAAFFPLFVLSLSSLSSTLLAQLLQANKLILSLAGVCALLALLEEDD